MKRIFALFLAVSLLFLTACTPGSPVATGGSDGKGDPQAPSVSFPKDTIVSLGGDFIHLPSRVIFHMNISLGKSHNVYYSKADGNVYSYCFDPLCDHGGGKCLAVPYSAETFSFELNTVCFIKDRFYAVAPTLGKILSFAFDGTDKRWEYDSGYPDLQAIPNGAWTPNIIAYGPYIYIDQRATTSEDGRQHLLRFNTETKEMEDLTEKTGLYVSPTFFYNDVMYGHGEKREYIKASADLTVYEEVEKYQYSSHFSGSTFISGVWDKEKAAIGFTTYDMATGESKEIPKANLGLSEDDRVALLSVDDNYVYYYNAKEILAGYKRHPKTGDKVPVYKCDGKIYRAKHDGTDAICIYDNPEIDYSYQATVFDGTTIIVYGSAYRPVEGEEEGIIQETKGYYVGTFREDGTIDSLEPVLVVS